MEVEVSDVVTKDKQGWKSLYQQYADFDQIPIKNETLDTVWDWIHDKDEEFYCIVARDKDQKLIAFMHYRVMDSPLRGVKVGFLDDLFVEPDFRGSGVVEKLFEVLNYRAKTNNWPFVRWITADDNFKSTICL